MIPTISKDRKSKREVTMKAVEGIGGRQHQVENVTIAFHHFTIALDKK
jgi:hypothetical protein